MSSILDLNGQPFKPSDAKRYAIVGTVRVHHTVYELEPGEDMGHAIRTHQILQARHDPKLAEITTSTPFFWAEDDDTRRNNRMALLQQLQAFFGNLMDNGTTQVHQDTFTLVDELLKKKEAGDQPEPPPNAA